MLRNRLYSHLKPLLPASTRLATRRWFALRKRARVTETWPILPGSERPPEGWPGWPDGKQFALVLTHDVEGQAGLDRCRQLMKLEMDLGFRSSFNFIPEGDYQVPRDLIEELQSNGFEVGVHDLHHDGKLYSSRAEFAEKARRINQHLKNWGAVGFRSGFMHHNLDWLHDLDVQYDCSTFDTDPFEPQPDGVNTIFPFWVPAPQSSRFEVRGSKSEVHPNSDLRSPHSALGSGYVELPYTLPQDFTLFVLLKEQGLETWMRKLDWIARHGGMAMVDVHPDYLNFGGNTTNGSEYPASCYENFLKHIAQAYSGAYWGALPRTVAGWYGAAYPSNGKSQTPERHSVTSKTGSQANSASRRPRAKKRAAVVTYSYYASDPRPRREAEALCRAGMDVDVICLRRDPTIPLHDRIDRVNVFHIPLKRRRDSKMTYAVQYTLFLLGAFGLLAKRAFKWRYALVHVHNMPDILVFSALLPKMLGAKVILDLHDPMPELFRSIFGRASDHYLIRWLEKIEKRSVAFADLVLTPNIAFKELFVSRGCAPEKIQIVMNSPQAAIFDPKAYAANTAESNSTSSPCEERVGRGDTNQNTPPLPSPVHEPHPVTPSLSPTGGEGARRAGERAAPMVQRSSERGESGHSLLHPMEEREKPMGLLQSSAANTAASNSPSSPHEERVGRGPRRGDTNKDEFPGHDRPFTVMYHGLLVERHGLDLAIRAMAQLRGRIPQLQFHLYGEMTEYMAEMIKLIQSLDLEEIVQYHGFKSLQEIARAISAIDLGLIPNRLNPFTRINMPTRIFEYLAMEKPVIVPRMKGIQDYFNEDQILFFAPEDADELARKIEWVYLHPEETRRMVGRGIEVYQKHRWESEERHFIDLVQNLIGTAVPKPEPKRTSLRRICMLSYSNYESDNRVMRYAEALGQRGDSVDALALRKDQSQSKTETIGRVHVSRIQCRSRKNQRNKLAYLFPLMRFWALSSMQITWRHLKHRYDVIHVHNVPDFLVFAAWLPKLTGARIILDIHDIVPEFYASKFSLPHGSFGVKMLKKVERASAWFADQVIISNHLWLDTFATRTGANGKCSVFINNVDANTFRPRPSNRNDGKLLIIFPGGLQWHQGLDIAIRAFQKVSARLPQAEFHIYGDGIMKDSLESLAHDLGLDGKVRFFSPVPVRQIADVMAGADLGVVPKRADSFGNEAYSTKIMEFMSLGVPVVVSNTKIDRFYFNDSVVRFFESGNPDALAEAMLQVLSDAALRKRMVANASEYATLNSWGTRKQEYLNLVDDLCEK